MTKAELYQQICRKRSILCVGLDSDIRKIPQHLLESEDPIFEFNRAIIDATAPYTVCYKPNTAFYEASGIEGWISLEKTVKYIKENYPEIMVIIDAKRGDIGNTCDMYARAFFETMNADAITVAPYMGRDSVEPFLKYEGKWSVVLALTSNPSSEDFENQNLQSGEKLYQRVLSVSSQWGTSENMMYVVGATKATALEQIRQIVPDHFLLVPGVGAQGGSLEEVIKYGKNEHYGLLVNSSRGIIYASQGEDFASKAADEAKALQQQMSDLL